MNETKHHVVQRRKLQNYKIKVVVYTSKGRTNLAMLIGA